MRHILFIILLIIFASCGHEPIKTLMLEELNIGMLLIIHNSDEKSVFKALRAFGTYHLIFDKEGKFKANNEIFKFMKDVF
jgi:hypothetical protein